MPIYEYACKACGHEFEVMQKIAEKPIRRCEACGRPKAERKISHTSFLLKGTGWYATDYAGRKAHGSSESEPTASSSSSSSDSPKPADRPADKPAASKPAPQSTANA